MKGRLILILSIIGMVVFGLLIEPDAPEELTFNKDIAPIIFKNCTPCHHKGGTAPFALEKYADVAKRTDFIRYVTMSRYMPPLKSNPHYRGFANERRLTDEEIEKIGDWINGGKYEGREEDKIYPPEYSKKSQLLAKPDLVLSMREPFKIPAGNGQTYICYKIPYELPHDTFVRAIEFVPGNNQIVHHASYQVLAVAPDVDIYNSPDYFIFGEEDYIDDEHDYGFFNLYSKDGKPPVEVFHNGWLPGTSPQIYPNGMGFYLPKKGILMIRNLHYAPTPKVEYDQSYLNLYFSDKPVERVIQFAAFKPSGLSLADTVLKANTVKTHEINVKIGADLSLIAVNPHMHLLGTYYKIWVTTPKGDTIPIIEIPEWDFYWQDFYRFKEVVPIPKGSLLHAEAIFDNTTKNKQNPNNPPIDVYFERGMDDSDEMMRVSFLFLPYRKGDENISMEVPELK